ncbi:asparaginase [Marinitenerispora sediminis]|uniref:Asparaginase n=1 Tax=Marinitenerispora sediminis TaxID=1931232 RepID=A0A368T6J9_9ACTN|nr:asparaginase [Marinitenerispora sediminis]RCV52295.1 asparaginase [Marinitenerispora sediminis]RCV58835.1 asparaginase [Marinitenerispora sediminis]RCV59353.1 asparaginase [Marinitenerispora sediminis]
MPESPLPDYAPLVEVVRSGFREGVHYGTAVGLTAAGDVGYARGPVDTPMFPRSSAKPFQALACLRAGADVAGERLAIAAGSHSGADPHVAAVRGMLADAGLTPEALRCPPDWPLDRSVRDALLRAGGEPERLRMNCSGKHAAMLTACVRQGWSTGDYLDPEHPLQALVRATTEEKCGEPVAHTAVDGCGAPQLAVSLAGLARGLRAMTLAEPDSAEARVLDAMRGFPEFVAGDGRPDTVVMRRLPGAVSKQGAEGVMVVSVPTGETAAVKISDGDAAGRGAAMAALMALAALGVDIDPVADLLSRPVLGGGEPVGVVRPLHR